MFNFKGASFGDFALSSGGFGQHILAVVAGDDRLGMAENHSGFAAASTSHIHEIRVGAGNKTFQLVGLSLVLNSWVQKVSVHLWRRIIILFIKYLKNTLFQHFRLIH